MAQSYSSGSWSVVGSYPLRTNCFNKYLKHNFRLALELLRLIPLHAEIIFVAEVTKFREKLTNFVADRKSYTIYTYLLPRQLRLLVALKSNSSNNNTISTKSIHIRHTHKGNNSIVYKNTISVCNNEISIYK